MKKITIELTEKEINALQICLSAEMLNLEEEVIRLENRNTTGVNTHKIECKRSCIRVCDALWNKLYDAESRAC